MYVELIMSIIILFLVASIVILKARFKNVTYMEEYGLYTRRSTAKIKSKTLVDEEGVTKYRVEIQGENVNEIVDDIDLYNAVMVGDRIKVTYVTSEHKGLVKSKYNYGRRKSDVIELTLY